jgi:hypothetical protein
MLPLFPPLIKPALAFGFEAARLFGAKFVFWGPGPKRVLVIPRLFMSAGARHASSVSGLPHGKLVKSLITPGLYQWEITFRCYEFESCPGDAGNDPASQAFAVSTGLEATVAR